MEINSDLLTQFSLMNKVSTGHPLLDVLMMLLIPYLLQRVMPVLKECAMTLWHHKKTTKTYTRSIAHTQRSNYYYYDNTANPPNSLLQTAITAYINTFPDLAQKLESADLELFNKKKKDKSGTDEEDEDEDDSYNYYDANSRVQTYHVNVTPPRGNWVEVEVGLRFMREEELKDSDKSHQVVTTFYFETDLPKGNVLIDDFVRKAFDYYKELQSKKRDLSRYLYMPTSISKAGEEGAPAGTLYKKYKLSEEKTFETLFHPDKAAILNLLDQFLHKKGKFAIPGYPRKLGFLLYGPPGTGKTTFIKALAQHTGRSVVSIPLARIRTNQELMDMMFDQRFAIEKDDCPASMPFNKTIFVMEDIDAASDVVNKRSSSGSSSGVTSADIRRALAASLAAQQENVEGKEGGSIPPTKKKSSDSEIEAADEDDKSSDDGGSTKKRKSKAFGPMPLGFGKDFVADDELNLAGLLNVLDGVVDTPERIIIMTTNHPEKLDPALVRPGRINKKVYMGRMRVTEALQLVRHYYGALPDAAEDKIRKVFVDDVWSPAQLESMCADLDTIQELLDALSDKMGAVRAGAGVVVGVGAEDVAEGATEGAEGPEAAAEGACPAADGAVAVAAWAEGTADDGNQAVALAAPRAGGQVVSEQQNGGGVGEGDAAAAAVAAAEDNEVVAVVSHGTQAAERLKGIEQLQLVKAGSGLVVGEVVDVAGAQAA